MLARVVLVSLLASGSSLRVQREEKNQITQSSVAHSDRLFGNKHTTGVTNVTWGSPSLLEKSKVTSCPTNQDGSTRTRCECWMRGAGSPWSIFDCFSTEGAVKLADAIYESSVKLFDCIYDKPMRVTAIEQCFRAVDQTTGIMPEAWANPLGIADDYNPWSNLVSMATAWRTRNSALAEVHHDMAIIKFHNTNINIAILHGLDSSTPPGTACRHMWRNRIFSIHGGGLAAIGAGDVLRPAASVSVEDQCFNLYWENCLQGDNSCVMIDWMPFKCYCNSGKSTCRWGTKSGACSGVGTESVPASFSYTTDDDDTSNPDVVQSVMNWETADYNNNVGNKFIITHAQHCWNVNNPPWTAYDGSGTELLCEGCPWKASSTNYFNDALRLTKTFSVGLCR